MASNLLEGTRTYLSGPMDFVGSRIIEKFLGWRSILTPILKSLGISVLDPWNKPQIKGHLNYGHEGLIYSKTLYEKDFWTNDETRARFETEFWETVHIDLRMVDLADFVISFVPTNIYSVGTVHEIITARLQLKPVLMISPPVKYDFFPEIAQLSEKTKNILKYYGLKENPHGIPSQWYGNIVGGHYMFDGFGWESLEIKSEDFYQELMVSVLDNAKPSQKGTDKFRRWEKVREWVLNSKELQALSGGVLDHVKFKDNERDILDTELLNSNEQTHKYFWYNIPYTPKRSVLYQIFSIASGYIPPRLQIISHLDEEGNIQYSSIESVDDSWLLISNEENE